MANDDEKYYRQDWMSDDQWECAKFWAQIMRGFHHVMGTFKPCGTGITISEPGGWFATYDFDILTRIVLLAHEKMVRVELAGGAFGTTKFILHKRHKRDGQQFERHPTIQEAIGKFTG